MHIWYLFISGGSNRQCEVFCFARPDKLPKALNCILRSLNSYFSFCFINLWFVIYVFLTDFDFQGLAMLFFSFFRTLVDRNVQVAIIS